MLNIVRVIVWTVAAACLLPAVVVSANPLTEGAGLNAWQSGGPDGGFVLGVAVDPVDADVAYVLSQQGGGFKTTDGGVTWTSFTAEVFAGRTPTFNQFLHDPVTSGTVYLPAAGVGEPFYVSTDAGATWTPRDEGLSQSVRNFSADPTVAGKLYASEGRGKVFRTTNAGQLWTALPDVPLTGSFKLLYGISVAPSDPDVLYAYAAEGVFVSSDAGVTWTKVNNGLPATPWCENLLIDPDNEDIALAVINNAGLYRTTDRGATWTRHDLTSSIPNASYRDFAMRPGDFSTLYLATSNGFHKSTDGGASWAQRTGVDQSLHALGTSPADADAVYVTSLGAGAFGSSDAGETWALRNSGIHASEPRSLARFPDPEAARIYVTGRRAAELVQFTENAGADWQAISDLAEDRGWAIAVHPTDEDIIYVGSTSDVFKTTNGGTSWSALSVGVFGQFENILIDPTAPDTVYVRSSNNSLYKTTDGGANWSPVNNGLPPSPRVTAVAMAQSNPTTLYAAPSTGTLGIYKTVDGGANWAPTAGVLAERIETIAVDPNDDGVVYASANSGFYKSIDGGASWDLAYPARARAIYIDPRNTRVVYASFSNRVWRSIDAGANWNALPELNTPRPIGSIIIGADSVNVVYAAAHDVGVQALELATDMALAISASQANAAVGDILEFTATVVNEGPMGEPNPRVEFFVPESFEFLSVFSSQGDECLVVDRPRCDLGPVEPGATATATLRVRVAGSGALAVEARVNDGAVVGHLRDDNQANDTDEATVDAVFDNDRDGIVDAADPDDDNDGVLDVDDAYPFIALDGRSDSDGDGVPDVCDADCLAAGMIADVDDDNDGVLDVADNCPLTANADQADADSDGVGDACADQDDGPLLRIILPAAVQNMARP